MATVDSITAKLQQIVDADLPGAVADIKAEVDALKAAAANPAALSKLDGLVDRLGAQVKAADPGPVVPPAGTVPPPPPGVPPAPAPPIL